MQTVEERLRALERKYFGKDSPIVVAVVGCGYAGVELAATVSERLKDKGVVHAIGRDTTILPAAPPGNREAALKVRNLVTVDVHQCYMTLLPPLPTSCALLHVHILLIDPGIHGRFCLIL